VNGRGAKKAAARNQSGVWRRRRGSAGDGDPRRSNFGWARCCFAPAGRVSMR